MLQQKQKCKTQNQEIESTNISVDFTDTNRTE